MTVLGMCLPVFKCEDPKFYSVVRSTWLGFKEEAAELKEGFLEEVGLMTEHVCWAGLERQKGLV